MSYTEHLVSLSVLQIKRVNFDYYWQLKANLFISPFISGLALAFIMCTQLLAIKKVDGKFWKSRRKMNQQILGAAHNFIGLIFTGH